MMSWLMRCPALADCAFRHWLRETTVKLWLSLAADNFSIRAVAMALFFTITEKHNRINVLMAESDRRLDGEPGR